MSRPAASVNGAASSASMTRCASASCSLAGNVDRSRTPSRSSLSAETTCTGSPSISGNAARSTSCRSMMALRAQFSADTSRLPRMRARIGTLYTGEPGFQRSRNHRRSCAQESGAGPKSDRLGMAVGLPAGCGRESAARASVRRFSRRAVELANRSCVILFGCSRRTWAT